VPGSLTRRGNPVNNVAAAAELSGGGAKSAAAPVHDSMTGPSLMSGAIHGGPGLAAQANADHYRGVAGWVKDYQTARTAGNVKLAKSIRNNIDAAVSKHGLDRTRVYGKGP